MLVAVVVTYFPELETLRRLIDIVTPQVEKVVVVDNASAVNVSTWLLEAFPAGEIQCLRLSENQGIAAAQNRGIQLAREMAANYVVLFDQDSEPAQDMVRKLLEVAEQKTEQGIALAAVGPKFIDLRRGGPIPFTRQEGLKRRIQSCSTNDSVVEVDYLISSGCLIPMSVLDQVGGMCEALFIDYVDIEWGLRARRKGFRSFGVCGAIMQHCLGDEPLRLAGRTISQHRPLRRYYYFRNAIWLYRKKEMPLDWKCADASRLFVRYIVYTLFSPPRYQQWKMMTLGIWHGLCGRMGRR